MLEILSENKKIIIILFIAAILIIIGVIWIPKKDIELSHYTEISRTERDKMVIKQYGDELKFALFSNDVDFLNSNVVDSYLVFNHINKTDYYNWLVNNNIITTNVKFGQTTKYEYDMQNIYSIEATLNGDSQRINIIEEYPERWKYSFGTFINYTNDEIKKQYDEYGVTIDSIYQDINYIKLNISLNVAKKDGKYLDISKSDSIKLVTNNTTSIIMATNDYTSETNIINGREYVTIECIFNISISDQDNIETIKIDAFKINNEEKNIKIDLNL